MYLKNISPASLLAACFMRDFLLDSYFNPEDGGDMFL
jgi:hypothetical protein